MPQNSNDFIAGLVDDLRPVVPLGQRRGMTQAVIALATAVVGLASFFHVRNDLMAGRPDAMLMVSAGLFLVLALASAWSVIAMARPFVGAQREGWGWTALMGGVLPVSAIGYFFAERLNGIPVAVESDGVVCMELGLLSGALTATVLVLWLRRGAPCNPARAGMMAGVAAGAAGTFAISLCCPHNDILHIGIWHGLTVVLSGVIGRIAMPRLIAW